MSLKEWIQESNNIVFFGGAGVSTESNIPDFRSDNGLYKKKYPYPAGRHLLRGKIQSSRPSVYRHHALRYSNRWIDRSGHQSASSQRFHAVCNQLHLCQDSIGRIPPNNPLQSGIDDDVHAVSVCLFHRARAKCRFAHVGYAVSQNSC